MASLKIDKPIRLIELFAGVGSQAKALTRLGANFEHYKISEWEVNATASYKAIHKENDNTDYSAEFTAEQLNEILFNIGISTDGKKPMGIKEITRKGEQWKRTVYNNFKVTNNIGSILNVVGNDLGIVDTDKYTYIMTYSFPCQDLSLAGKGNGMAKGSGTRSGLLWEVERLLNECTELPQILLMENVTQVHGTKNKEHFDEWIAFLESKGYSNYWKDLNAKNFGIPQNRNRTFMVSVLGDYTYEFPKEFPLELRLKDMLEDSVDEKFYLSGKMINYFTENTKKQQAKGNGFRFQPTDGSGCGKAITTHTCGGGNTEPKVLAGVGEKKSNGGTQWYQQDRIYDDKVAISVTTAFNPYYAVAMRGRYNENDEVEQNIELSDREYANAITTVQKDSLVAEPLAYDEQNGYIRKDGTVGTLTTDGSSPKHNNRVVEPVKLGYIPYPNSGKAHQSNTFYDANAISPTLDTCEGGNRQVKIAEQGIIEAQIKRVAKINSSQDGVVVCSNGIAPTHTAGHGNTPKVFQNYRIRKLTPLECWRLMGFDDADFEKAATVNSNSQLYKQAGNSIVVDVLCYILGMML